MRRLALLLVVLALPLCAQFPNFWKHNSDGSLSPRNGESVTLGSTASVALTCDGSTDNYARIQAALTTTGNVVLNGSGTCMISNTLVISSNTRLSVAPTAKIKAAASTNKPLLVNSAYNSVATTTTVTLSASTNLSLPVAWTAHGLIVGDYIWLQGSSPSNYNGVFKVTTVTDANNITVMMWRYTSTAPSGTALAKKCDTNIIVEGGVWDYNYPASSGGNLLSHAIILGVAQNVVIRDLTAQSAAKYILNLGAVRDVAVSDLAVPTNGSDLVKVYGPAANLTLKNISGKSGDDGISFQTKEADAFSAYRWTYGDIMNCVVDGVDIEQTSAPGVVTYYTSTDEWMGGMIARNIMGNSTANVAVAVRAPFATSTFNDLLVENVSASGKGILDVYITGSGTLTMGNLTVNHVTRNPINWTVASINEDFIVGPSVTLNKFTVNDFTRNIPTGFPSTTSYAFNIAGTIDEFNAVDCISRTASGGRFFIVVSTGVLRKANFTRITQTTGDGFVNIASGVAVVATFSFTDCDVKTTNVFNVSASANVSFTGNRFESATQGVIRTAGTPTINAYSSGNTLVSGSWLAVPSGTPVLNIYGWDFQTDASTTGVSKINGGFLYNTNAALGTLATAGPVMADGTNWRRMKDPTLLY